MRRNALLTACCAALGFAGFAAAQPANDSCANATPLTLDSSVFGTTTGTVDDPPLTIQNTFCNSYDMDVWYSFDPAPGTEYRIELLSTTGLTCLAVMDMCNGSDNPTNPGSSPPFPNFDSGSSGDPPGLDYTSDGAGTPFIIRVGSQSEGRDFEIIVTTPPPAPGNDLCANATLVGSIPFFDSVSFMERATGDPDLTACNTDNDDFEMNNAVWWRFEGNDANMRVTFNDIDFAGAYSVFSGSCAGLSEVGCADIGTEIIDFFAQSGTTYFFVIMHDALLPITDTNNTAEISVEFAPGGPANDACVNAEPISLNVNTAGTTVGASGSDIASCGFDERDVWYSFTPAANTTYSVDTSSLQNDVSIAVFESFCPFTEDQDLGCASTTGLTTSYAFTSDCTGTPVWIRIASDQNEETDFSVTVSVAPAAAPANDRCCAATPLVLAVPTLGTTADAMRSQPGVASCGSDPYEVWYSFTPTVPSASYRVSVTNVSPSNVNMGVAVFANCPEAGGFEFDCQDPTGNNASIDFVALGTSDVLIRVGTGSATSPATFNVLVEAEATPTNCSSARLITSVPFTDTWEDIETAFADEDFMSCNTSSAEYMHNGVWWRYDGDGQRLRITLDDINFSGAFAAFSSSDCFFFTEEFCRTTGPETFDIQTSPGQTYYFVASNNSSSPLTDTNNDATIDVQVAPPIPANDECVNAIALSANSPAAGTTVAATGFDQATCGFDERDVWYSFDPAPSTRYFITISGATETGSLSIFSACDDFIDLGCISATNPVLDFTSDNAGSPFLIRFATDETAESDFTILLEVAPTPPANDQCTNATGVALGVPVAGTTVNASGTDVATCGADEWDVWYTFNAAAGVEYRATALNLTGAASISAFSFCESNQLACDTGSASSVAWVEFMGSGAPVFVRVASNTGETVDFELLAEVAPSPANDNCAAAQALSAGVDTAGSTRGATQDSSSTCGSDEWDVWYTFTPAPSTTYQVRVENFTSTPSLELFSACGGAGSQCETSSPLIIQFTSSAGGDPVFFRVATDELSQQETDFTIRVDPRAAPPANDLCANAIAVARGVTAQGTTLGALQDGSASCGADEWDVWYTFTPAPNTAYRARLENTTTATSLAIFSGCGGGEIACDSGADDLPPVVNFTSDGVGSPVTIRVATDEGLVEETDFNLTVDFPPPPPANDLCANATSVSLNQVVNGTTVGASGTNVASCGGDELDVWYSFDPEPNTLYRARIIDTTGAISLAVYNSCGGVEFDCNTGGSVVPHVDFMSDALGSPVVARVASDEGNFEEIDFVFSVNLALVPENDLCTNATIVNLGEGPFFDFQDTVSATSDGDSFSCASLTPNNNKSIWYSVTTASTMELVATITPVFYNPNVVVYTGTCGNWTEVTCAATGGNGSQDIVTWTAQAGTTYLVSTGDDGSLARGGLTEISIRSTCPCEYNGVAGVNVFDLLVYLDLWFTGAPGAEADGIPGINVFDLLAYLDCWFPASAGNPCP